MHINTDIRFLLCIFALGPMLILSNGCHSQSKPLNSAVDLYVDAVMFREMGETEQALKKLESAVEIDQKFSLAHSLLGDIYQQIKNYEKSAGYYETATKLNPWSFHDFFNLGKVYHIMKRSNSAIKAYVKACELKPEHLQAHIGTAECYCEIERYDDALSYGHRAEQINPDANGLQKVLGDIYKSQEDYEQAVNSYKRALENDSNNTEIMISLGVVYLRTERIEPAQELLKIVTEKEPENGAAYKHLGYCYLKFYDRLKRSYKSEEKTDESDEQLLGQLKEQANQQLEQAIRYYTKAIEIDENDWDAHRGLGVAYILKSRTTDAMSEKRLVGKAIYHWRLSLQINPDQPRSDNLRKWIARYKTS